MAVTVSAVVKLVVNPMQAGRFCREQVLDAGHGTFTVGLLCFWQVTVYTVSYTHLTLPTKRIV